MIFSKFNLYSDSYKFILAAEKLSRGLDFKPLRLGSQGMIYSELQETLFFKWLYPILITLLKIIGIETLTAAHLTSFTCGLFAIAAIFFLATEVYRNNRHPEPNSGSEKSRTRAAVFTTLILLFSGSRLIWSSIVVSDTINLFLVTLFFWALFSEKVSFSGLLLALVTFNKPENLILIVPASVLLKKQKIRFFIALALPLIFLYAIIFIIINPNLLPIIEPSLLNQPTYPHFLVNTLGTDGFTIIAGTAGLLLLAIRNNRRGIILGLTMLLLTVIYYLHNPYQERYLLALLPMLCVGAGYFINRTYELLMSRAARGWLISVGLGVAFLSIGAFQLKTAYDSLPKLDYEQEVALKVKSLAANLSLEENPILVAQRPEPYYLFTQLSTWKFLDSSPYIPQIPQPKIVVIDESLRAAKQETVAYLEKNYSDQKIAEISTESEFRTTTKKYKPQKPVELYLIP